MAEEHKRKNPREIIESGKKHHLENLYLKFPGKEMERVPAVLSPVSVQVDYNDVKKMKEANENKKFDIVHDHPSFIPYIGGIFGCPIPSSSDFNNFLREDDAKSLVVSQKNARTGKLEGYGIFKKTEKTKDSPPPNLLQRFFYGIATSSCILDNLAVKYMAKSHNLNYKFVPAEQYAFNSTLGKFIPQKKSKFNGRDLELKVASIIGILFLASIILFSSNITGFEIANLTKKTSNILGIILFVVGLIGTSYYLRKLKNKIK